MFFMRLRRGARWAFIVLIIVFAFTFLFAGVGSGGSGGDVIQELLGMRGTDPVKSAEKAVAESPRNTDALQRLAQAYVAEDRRGDAIKTFQRFMKLKPKDISGLSQLARLQEEVTTLRWNRYARLQTEAEIAFGPLSTDPLQTLAGTDTLLTAYTSTLSTKLNQAYGSYIAAAKSSEDTYKRYVKAIPAANTLQRATVEIDLARVATNAGDYPVAIKSYKTFLKLTPKSPLAPQVKKALAELEKAQSSR